MAVYTPESPPITVEAELQEYLIRELSRVGDSIRFAEEIILSNTNVAPTKPSEGTILYADGVNFNPGSGEGFYGYINGVWYKLSLVATDDLTIDDLTADTVRITGTTELTLASTTHPFQVGPSSAQNLATDTDEIQSRNNGAAAALNFNPHGGDINIGDAASIIDILGGQIKFPASQNASADANTLDDYEEGTWTPRIDGTTAAGVGTYSVQAGTYTKIGRAVTAYGLVVWSAHTGTGNMLLAGLPFTAANNPVAGLAAANLTFPGTVALRVTSGGTTAQFVTFATGAALNSLAIDAAATVQFSVTYEV